MTDAIWSPQQQQSNLAKGKRELDAIVTHLAKETQRIRTVLVGPGTLYTHPKSKIEACGLAFIHPIPIDLKSSYQPFLLVSYLEAAGLDYDLGIVDLYPNGLQLLHTQEEIRLRASDFREFPTAERLFNEYVARCKLSEGEYGRRKVEQVFEKDGLEVAFASIPKTFRRKRKAGEVRFVEGNITEVGLPFAPLDLIVCLNVLQYQPDTEARKRALSNMRNQLGNGKYLVVNDIWDIVGDQDQELGVLGWKSIDPEIQRPDKLLGGYVLQKVDP